MIAIEADLVGTDTTPTEHLAPFHKKHPDAKLDIACYNGPNNYVVAGSTAHIDLLESYLNERRSNSEKLRFKVLRGMHAYHSSMADSIVEKSAQLSASIPFQVSGGTYLIAPMQSLSNLVLCQLITDPLFSSYTDPSFPVRILPQAILDWARL